MDRIDRVASVAEDPDPRVAVSPGKSWRLVAAVAYVVLLIAAFGPPLLGLVFYAADSELHSYILLIPFISAYLVFVHRAQLPKRWRSSPGPGIVLALFGLFALVFCWGHGALFEPLSAGDYFSAVTFSFLCFLVAGGFFFLGKDWVRATAFPVGFLFLTIPMPDAMASALETASQLASAEATSLLFNLSGMTFLRTGTVFQLPNISIRVAQECSGIRSSWILLITSLLASYLFLRTPWRRALLVAFVIPLGIIRNGFRIFVIGTLCVRYGPKMIDSVIHHRGGPLFFALSLIPLFFLLWWLRRGDQVEAEPSAG